MVDRDCPGSPGWRQLLRPTRRTGHAVGHFLGPREHNGADQYAQVVRTCITDAGLEIVDLQMERLRVEFFDVGAVIYFLRKVIWFLPDFTVEGYHDRLRALHERIQAEGPFVTYSTRALIEARKPS